MRRILTAALVLAGLAACTAEKEEEPVMVEPAPISAEEAAAVLG